MIVSLDLETHSPVDLTQCGASVYFEHPATDVLCMAYHLVGEPSIPALWIRGTPPPPKFIEYVRQGASFSGWNVMFFDRPGYRDKMVRLGFPPINDDNWEDSMHRAAAANLPRSLDGCAAAVGVPFELNLKDNNRLRRITDAKRTPVPSQEDLDWLHARCVQDVIMEEQVLLRLPPWPVVEPWRNMPAIDRRINDRGVMIDVALVQGLVKAARTETHRLNTIMAKITDGKVPATSNVGALKEWLIGRGVPLRRKDGQNQEDMDPEDDEEDDSTESPWILRKTDIADLLARPDIADTCREALMMRAEAGKASVRKLNKMLACANSDARLRGMFKLMGAQQAGRFSGSGPQLHNTIRDVFANPDEIAALNNIDGKKYPDIVAELQSKALRAAIEHGTMGDADLLRMLYERKIRDAQGREGTAGVLTWISRMSRRTITAAEGKVFLNGDFSSAQARIMAWIAQELSLIDAFSKNEDVYKVIAAGIFNTAIDALTKQMRQSGKVTLLAGSFGGGYKALIAMAYAYGMLLTEDEARELIRGLRLTISKIAELWTALEDAAANAVMNPGYEYYVPPLGIVSYFMNEERSALCCRLPSSRLLRYWAPRLVQNYWPDGRPMERLSLTCLFIKGKHAVRRFASRTILSNNIAQAVETDMLCVTLENCEKAGLPISIHVHDSASPEVEEEHASQMIGLMQQCMLEQPAWTRGLPISCDIEVSPRFG